MASDHDAKGVTLYSRVRLGSCETRIIRCTIHTRCGVFVEKAGIMYIKAQRLDLAANIDLCLLRYVGAYISLVVNLHNGKMFRGPQLGERKKHATCDWRIPSILLTQYGGGKEVRFLFECKTCLERPSSQKPFLIRQFASA